MRRIRIAGACAAALVVVLGARSAPAGTLTGSDASSNERVDAADLDAIFNFEINTDTNQLVLTVSNLTEAFKIQQVFFNVTDDVESLTLVDGPDGFVLRDNRSANGFGKFDIGLFGKGGRKGAAIDPGETMVFTFDFSGDAVDQSDFITETARKRRGSLALAAARFRGAPGNGNAFGAVFSADEEPPPADSGDPLPPDGGDGGGGGETPVTPIPLPSAAVMGLALLAGLAGRRPLLRG